MSRAFSTLHSRIIIRGGADGPEETSMEYLIEMDDLDEGFKVASVSTPKYDVTLAELWKQTISFVRKAEEMPPKDNTASAK